MKKGYKKFTEKNETANGINTLLTAGLSPEMKRCVDFIKEHGKIIRYDGGFWAEENAELKPGYNGGRIEYYYPENHFGTNTVKSLLKRGVIITIRTKTSKYGEYPVECSLACG